MKINFKKNEKVFGGRIISVFEALEKHGWLEGGKEVADSVLTMCLFKTTGKNASTKAEIVAKELSFRGPNGLVFSAEMREVPEEDRNLSREARDVGHRGPKYIVSLEVSAAVHLGKVEVGDVFVSGNRSNRVYESYI